MALSGMEPHPEDIIREPRPHSSLGETDEEEGSVRSYDDIVRIRSHDEESVRTYESEGDSNARRQRSIQRQLSQEETVQLVRQKVEAETKLSLVGGNEAVSDVVKPKLAIDLGHSNIAWLSEGVVDIIKDSVETYVPLFLFAQLLADSLFFLSPPVLT